MPTVVVVGGREAAIAAALRLNYQVFVLSERRRLRRHRSHLAGFAQISFDSPRATFLRSLKALLNGAPVDAVLAVTERAVLPAAWMREALGLHGHTSDVAHRCRNKAAMKAHAQTHQIPCAEFVKLSPHSTAASLVQRLGLPIVIKPTDSSGSRGSRVARHMSDLYELPGAGHIAESFVYGIEMSVESLVHEGRILFANPSEYLLPLWELGCVRACPKTQCDIVASPSSTPGRGASSASTVKSACVNCPGLSK